MNEKLRYIISQMKNITLSNTITSATNRRFNKIQDLPVLDQAQFERGFLLLAQDTNCLVGGVHDGEQHYCQALQHFHYHVSN